MTRVVFVCHGNICRSPMAELFFRDLVKKRGLDQEFEISSCGTSREEVGNGVYPPAAALLKREGISSSEKRAKQFEQKDYESAHYILVMEEFNRKNLLKLTPDPLGKIHRLLDFSPQPKDISDPWYHGDFEGVFAEIKKGCIGFLEKIKN